MDYSIVEMPFIMNEDGSTEPLFKVIDSENNNLFFGASREECKNFIKELSL